MKGIARAAVVVELGLVVLAWGVGYLLRVPIWSTLELAWPAVGWGLLATLPLMAGALGTMHAPGRVFADLRHLARTRVVPLFADCSLFDLALIALMAGIGEELFFRALLQGGLTRVAPLWMALGVASLLFGLAHFVSWFYAFLVFLVGLYLGLLFIASGNLLVPMVAHALYDVVGLVYLVRHRPLDRQSPAEVPEVDAGAS